MKKIRYSLTLLGIVEVPENSTDEEILEFIKNDYECFADFSCVNDVDYDEVEEDW